MEREWNKVTVHFRKEQKDIVNAYLLQLEPDSLLESETYFELYFDSDISDDILKEIKNIPGVIGDLKASKCVNKNWNEVWESNYEPIEIDDFCQIRAEFHSANPALPYQIIIRPQMAFGTGHHETTYMMIEAIHRLNVKGKSVWDYGCGTAILSVFAYLKGATKLLCNDIETWAVENSKLHFELNGIGANNYEVLGGNIDVIPESKFDIILANINRKVLLESTLGLRSRLKENGTLLMSGILDVDQDLVLKAYASDFKLVNSNQKGEWICMEMQVKNS